MMFLIRKTAIKTAPVAVIPAPASSALMGSGNQRIVIVVVPAAIGTSPSPATSTGRGIRLALLWDRDDVRHTDPAHLGPGRDGPAVVDEEEIAQGSRARGRERESSPKEGGRAVAKGGFARGRPFVAARVAR